MDAAQSTKNLAQTFAKQIASEPWEILKQAEGQVFPGEETPAEPEKPAESIENKKLLAARDSTRSRRLLQALETELKEIARIRKEKEVKEVPDAKAPKPLPEIVSKPGREFLRIFGGGKKAQMRRQQTQTERPLPPSG
ncbi:hypothetical protein COY30_00535 [Candidatus Woesebacteria bacterium CG_4_10_14_0_2_um_filter_44_9]|uniref:Uncharacterized protein n=1 Tax=Candidatus Woesebacteria bacterium CG_4_10_14_0_2_um_filter_44_9 TaxID=1975055 RepID=A0A2M7TIK5_9BACT|nr:MAG: hypothetical protein COY30_00535 [Candidatus Woesebacteria bacterium CG_4_10_14_0_2_um_filter_44_9]